MQHETKMENQSWLKKLARRLGPGHVVNLCFIVVLLFSTLLTWREVVVLEDAYISSQRNHLENVANALDKHLPGKSNSTDDAPCQSMAYRMH